jgi:two-component system, chemotaxis family, sensor kinase CheA
MKKLRQLFLSPVSALVLVFLVASGTLYWMSKQSASVLDANGVNVQIAGRERLEWQRVMRFLYELRFADSGAEDQIAADAAREEALSNLRISAKLLDEATAAFTGGGSVDLGRAGVATVNRSNLTSDVSEAAQTLASLWSDIAANLKPAIAGTRPTPSAVQSAFKFALEKDAEMSRTLSTFVGLISFSSFDAASRLSRLQYVASILGALFIGFLIWLFSRQLKKVNAARSQMTEILSTVPSGLMLLDSNFKLSSQYSAQLEKILGQADLGGKDFFALFAKMADSDTLSTARDYMDLLFGDQVDENLIKDVNPLDQVSAMIPNASGRNEKRTLNFGFKRVIESGKLSHLLVTVNDVSQETALKEQVAKLEKQGDQNMGETLELITGALSIDRGVLDDRLTRYRQLLDEANDKLKSAGRGESAYRMLIDEVFRPIHTLKGETAALNLRVISTAASDAEQELSQLRAKPDLNGNDFLALTIKLDELYDRLSKLKQLAAKLPAPMSAAAQIPAAIQANESAIKLDSPLQLDMIRQAVSRTAEKLGKSAELLCSGFDKIAIPAPLKQTISDILVHLSRNALAHGIESPAQRTQAGKAAAGKIQAQLVAVADGYEVLFRDDGRGLDFAMIKKRAIAMGKLSADQAASVDPRQLAGLIFEPGFSTQDGTNESAGHGVGLDVVMAAVKRAGGKIAVGTQQNQYTQFRIKLPSGL